jgi:hypothetical protein
MTKLTTATKAVLAAVLLVTVLVAGIATMGATHRANNSAELQAADRFAQAWAGAGGINLDAVTAVATPQVAQATAAALGGQGYGAGFNVIGPARVGAAKTGFIVLAALPAGGDNVTVPTDRGDWRMQVVDYNGRYLVAAA